MLRIALMKNTIPFFLILSLLTFSSVSAETLNGFAPTFYGFIKASSIYSTEALASYNNVNLSAPTHAVATLKASFTTVYYVDPNAPLAFPPLVPCSSGYDSIGIAVLSGPFNFCSAPASRLASDLGNGDADYLINDDSGYSITVRVRAAALASVEYISPVNQTFRCDADCAGVVISEPDVSGQRTVTFTHAVLHEAQEFPRPGPRTATLNSGALSFPPL